METVTKVDKMESELFREALVEQGLVVCLGLNWREEKKANARTFSFYFNSGDIVALADPEVLLKIIALEFRYTPHYGMFPDRVARRSDLENPEVTSVHFDHYQPNEEWITLAQWLEEQGAPVPERYLRPPVSKKNSAQYIIK